MKNILLLFSCLAFLFLFSSCEEDGPTLPVTLSISPSGTNVIPPGKVLLFNANAEVEWEVPDTLGGTITPEGVYTAPNQVGTYTILAVSKDNPTTTATYRVYVTQFHELLARVKRGGYVLYFRHAKASVGVDKLTTHGKWYLTCRQDSARQISPEGLEDAEKIGQVLAGLDVPIDSAYSSEFCRCKMTVDSMDLGLKVNYHPNLTYFVYGESQRHARTLSLINRLKVGSGHNMMVVAHSYAAGSTLPNIQQGDMDVFIPKAGGEVPEYVGRVPLSAFLELYRD